MEQGSNNVVKGGISQIALHIHHQHHQMQNYCDSLNGDLGSGGASSQSATGSTPIHGSCSDWRRPGKTSRDFRNDDTVEKPKRRRTSSPDQKNVDSQSPAAPLLLPPKQKSPVGSEQCQWVQIEIVDEWVNIGGRLWWMTNQSVWKNESTPVYLPQYMMLNNQWVWMCVQHQLDEARMQFKLMQQKARVKAEEDARWIALHEENVQHQLQVLEQKARVKEEKEAERQRVKEEKEAERQRVKEEKEAKKKAELEESKLQEHQKHQQELLQKLNRETDEQKRRNLKVGLEYSCRLLKERIDESKDEQTKKQLENWLGKEFRELLQIPTGPTHVQNKYLNNLEGRKKKRGHSESEEYQKNFQRMKDAKKVFDKTAKAVQHKQIEEEFPELKELIRAIADGCSDDIEFSEEDAAAMAGAKVREMLDLLAKDARISVDDILPPGMTLEQFLNIDRKDDEVMDSLNALAMEEAEKKGESLLDAEAIEQADIERFGELSFLTCLQILIYRDDIIDGVVQKKVGAIQHPTSRKWLFFACIPNELIAQFCIGSIVFEGLDLEDFERVIRINGKYVIQLFGGEEYIRLYRVTETSIERIHFNVSTTDNLFTFNCNTQRDKSFESEKKYASDHKKWSLHRLEQVVLFNLDLGMNKCEWFRDYFGSLLMMAIGRSD